MKNTYSLKFNSAFDASHFAMLVESMGAIDATITLEDNWYTVDYTIDAHALMKAFETYMETA